MPAPTPKLSTRIWSFSVLLSGMVVLIFGILPWLTSSVDILHRMSITLDTNDIDPTRYYYTDVVQVAESELYLATALNEH